MKSVIRSIALLFAAFTLNAADGFWQGASPLWSDTDNWENGTSPGDGGTAYFQNGQLTSSNDIAGLTLGGITLSNRTTTAGVTWVLANGIPFSFSDDPASTSRLDVAADRFNFRAAIGEGSGTLVKAGTGILAVETASLFTGRWLIEDGLIELATGDSLLAVPDTFIPDAITLDGGSIKNNDSSPVFPPNMGITLGERGGFFSIGWTTDKTISYQSPITGPGALMINYNNGRHLLQNPANDYAGGTVVGTNGPGWYGSNFAYLQLDADGVLPYGSGKGGLLVNGAHRGIVDIAGHSNRVTSLTSSGAISNSVPGVGALYVDDLDLRGRLGPGSRVVWLGGALNVQMQDGNGAGTIEIPQGATPTLTGSLALGGANLLLDGSTLSRTTGAETEAILTSNSGILLVGASGTSLLASGPEPYPALVLHSGLMEAADNTAHAPLTANTSIVLVGQPSVPALFDADLALPQGATLTFRNAVWLSHAPPAGQWLAEPGAAIYLDSDALSQQAAFAGHNLMIVADNISAFTSPITIPADNKLWFDTLTRTGTTLSDAPGNTLNAAQDIALASDGLLGFTGQGTVTHTGAISGSGSLVKDGAGTAILSGANTFSGSVAVNAGQLVVNSAAALGAAANTVTISGGHLANTADVDLALAQAVTVQSGGFTVNGGSITLGGGLTLGSDGTLDKQGDGELIIDSTAFAHQGILNLTGSAVVLDVPQGTTHFIAALKGTGDLIKRGGGTLTVRPSSGYTGRVVMEAGTLLEDAAPAPALEPAFWLDASAAHSLVFAEDSSTDIIAWRDARDTQPSATNHPYAFLNTQLPNDSASNPGYKTALPPVLMPYALDNLPVVDFGAYTSGQWLEFTPVANARTFFWVVGSQNGGGLLIGSPDKGCARGYSPSGGGDIEKSIDPNFPLWNNGSWNATEFSASQNWINGAAVNGNTAGLSGGWDLVATIASGPITVNGLQKEMRVLTGGQADKTGRSGGGRIAEFIVYDRVLTDEEREATESYLRAKWLPAESGGVSDWLSGLHVAGDSTLDLPPEMLSLRFSSLTGSATLTKTGAGAFSTETPETFSGTLALAEGTFTADGFMASLTADAALANPVPGAAFWVDASAAGTFGTDDDGRVFWRDTRWSEPGDWLVATQKWSYAPALISNAVGRLPVVDIGPVNAANGTGMQWSTNLSNIRTVFWLIGSQQGGGILLGGDDANTSSFNRYKNYPSAGDPIYSSYTSVNITNGITRIDGVQVDGTVTGLSGGYQVIALRTAGNVFAGQFARDRNIVGRSGGQRLGEVIVYTNALSDADMASVEAYLLNKWRRPYARDISATLHALDVPEESEPPAAGTLAVGVRELKVTDISGSGMLRKTGSGALTVGRAESFSGELAIEGGLLALSGYNTLPRSPAFWLDASRRDTLELAPGTRDITKWHDCRFNGLCATNWFGNTRVGSVTYTNLPPVLSEDDLNGMPAVDFGAWQSSSHLSWSQPFTAIRTVFWVFGSQAGGGLLLSYDRDTGTRHFYRAGGGVDEEDLLDITHSNPLWSAKWSYAPVNKGQTRINGVTVNGETTGLSGGWDLISLRTTGDASASSFGNDRNRQYRNATGGQRLAEVIVYEEELTDDEIRQVENYLRIKWALPLAEGTDVSGTTSAAPMTLTLRNNAHAVLGVQTYQLNAIGGIGSVSAEGGSLTASGLNLVSPQQIGDALTLAAPLTFTADTLWQVAATSSEIAPVVSSADVTFVSGGMLSASGARGLAYGEHVLVSCAGGGSLTGFAPSAWTVTSDDPTRQFSLAKTEDAVYLRVFAKGVLFLLK